MRARCAALAGVLAISSPGTAVAQTPAFEGYAMAPLEEGSLLSAWGAQTRAPGSLALAGGLYVWAPTPSVLPEEPIAGAARTVSTMEALVGVGVWEGFDLSAGVSSHHGPLRQDALDAAGAETRVLGDVRVVPRLRLSGGDEGGLALLVPVSIPLGARSPRAADGVALEPRLAAHYGGGPFTVTVNAGYLTRPVAPEGSPASTDAVTGAIGTAVRLFESWSVLAEVAGRAPLPRLGDTQAPTASAEVRGAVRYSFTHWAAQLGAGTGFPGLEGEAAWQVLANVSFTPGSAEEPARRSEDQSEDPSEDAWRDEPAPGSDLDDLGRHADRGSTPSAVAQQDGCPAGQEDPDGLGCVDIPREAPGSEVGEPATEVREVIWFEINDTHIDPKYGPVLDELAERLKASPDARIIIEGHSDRSGPPRFNRELSRMRASTVRYHLFQRGVAWHRMWLAPQGASRPLTDEKDEAGRSRNRRVEVRMLRGRPR